MKALLVYLIRASSVSPALMNRSIAGLLIALVVLVALCSPFNFAIAATTDCIEDGGQRVCTKPFLSPWNYGFCIGNSLSTTTAAANYCSAIDPQPWMSENKVIAFTECLPVQQFGACTAQANLTGWAGPGSSDSSLLPQCATHTVVQDTQGNELIGYSRMSPTFQTYSSPGVCNVPGNYYGMFAKRTRQWTCPAGYDLFTKASGVPGCRRNTLLPVAPCVGCDGSVNTGGGASFGNPIQVGDQTKTQTQTDYSGPVLRFVRSYRSRDEYVPDNGQTYLPKGLGKQWTHNYERRIYPFTGNAYL
ncbi:MAG: hypothetical protein ABL878_00990, partial [Burkholderiales bacterium]